MNQIQRKSPFWSMAGPLLGYLSIQWGVQFVIQFLIEMPYALKGYKELLGQDTVPSMDEIMNTVLHAMEPGLEIVLKYQVEIAGTAALCTLVLTAILFSKDRKLEKRFGVVLREKVKGSKYWTIVVFGLAGCVGATSLMAMAQLALYYDAAYQQTAEAVYSAGIPMQILMLGIVMPLSEELMFRGILFKRFRERQNFMYSAVCSAIFFALMHSNVIQTVYAFLLGMMLAYVYEKFGSFKAPLILHIVMNTGSVVFTELGVFDWIGAEPVRLAAASIIGAFICSAVFVTVQKVSAPVRPVVEDRKDPGDMFR